MRGTRLTREQFLTDCRARAREEEIFEQSYLCNPMGAAASHIVDWSAVERCRADYGIERVHLEADEVRQRFGEFVPTRQSERERQIGEFIRSSCPRLFVGRDASGKAREFRVGFDVAASGQGDLAALYIDETQGNELSLRSLFTCRTEDWHFLKSVLFYFLRELGQVRAAGDESGLGRQICWEAARQFGSRFKGVNFRSQKDDLGFALMNQLSVAQKRFPRGEQDIAADYFALRKVCTAGKWSFSESKNSLNAASHCDLAWAGALASYAHAQNKCTVWAAVGHENGWSDENGFHPYRSR